MLRKAAQICNNRKKLLLSARFYEKNENRGGNQRSPEEKRKASMEEAQKILDQIFETTSMMKGQVKTTKSDGKADLGQIKELELLTQGLASHESVNYFNPAEVEEYKKRDKISAPKLQKFLADRYKTFQNECYDDGWNKKYAAVQEGRTVSLPTTNEEGARHKQYAGDWRDHVFTEKYLKGMPKDGAIGLFMESAAAGLSQNPFYTVDEKKEHLEFFRQYFVNYEDDLVNLDAIEAGIMKATEPIITTEQNEEGKEVWPTEKVIMERYKEMSPWSQDNIGGHSWKKEWSDDEKGPMRYRIWQRRLHLAKLETAEKTADTSKDELLAD